MNPKISYYLVGGSRWTFQDEEPRKFAQKSIEGKTLNPFAGQTQLKHDGQIIRNDLAPDIDAEYNLDALKFVQQFDDESIDSVIHDPPWSAYQSETKYDLAHPENLTELKEEYHRVLKPGGVVVQFGYSSSCMPARLEYEREAVELYAPHGLRKDFIGVRDRKRPRLSDFD